MHTILLRPIPRFKMGLPDAYNAVAESFFQLLKRERIRKHVYATRKEARSDVFSYIEMFYNPIRRHSSADGLSPVEFERRNSVRLATV